MDASRDVLDPSDPGGRDLDDLEGALRVSFRDAQVLRQALVHRSWAFEHDDESNERLEFLGDAVLDVVVTDELYHLRPEYPEGRLAELRAAAVSERSLAAVARGIDLGSHLLLGVGEADSGGSDKDSLLADGLEAVLGAIYLDQGFVAAYDVTQRLFAGRLGELLARRSVTDPKTALQEHVEATIHERPAYEVSGSGPDHERTFEASVTVEGSVVGTGRGTTKKSAERAAALEAMRELADEPELDIVLAVPAARAGTRGRGHVDRPPTADAADPPVDDAPVDHTARP